MAQSLEQANKKLSTYLNQVGYPLNFWGKFEIRELKVGKRTIPLEKRVEIIEEILPSRLIR
ncbi:MAG: hypothetical protein AABW91_03960 [Nanoarchaeota archaeon]